MGPERERREGRLHEQATPGPLADVPALHDPVPTVDLLIEERADPAGRLDAQVTADGTRAEALPQQELGRPDRAAGEHHGSGAHAVIAAAHANRAPGLDQHAPYAVPRPDAG